MSWLSRSSDAVGKMNVGPAPTMSRPPKSERGSGKCENGVAEPGGPFSLPALIEMGDGIDDWHHRADNQPLLLGQPQTQQRLELQIALHPMRSSPRGISVQLLFCCSCSAQLLANGLLASWAIAAADWS